MLAVFYFLILLRGADVCGAFAICRKKYEEDIGKWQELQLMIIRKNIKSDRYKKKQLHLFCKN